MHTSVVAGPKSLWVNGRPPSSLLLPATHPLVHHLVALAPSRCSRCVAVAALSPLGPGLLSLLGPGRRWGLEPRGVAAPRKPFNVDVVHLGKMLFENPSGFEFVLAYTELVGKMLF